VLLQENSRSFVEVQEIPQARYPIGEWRDCCLPSTDTFTIQGRGIVLLPELNLVEGERFDAGDPLTLKRPDGAQDTVRIGGISLLKPMEGRCQPVIWLSSEEQRGRAHRDRSVVCLRAIAPASTKLSVTFHPD
jgi:hypothetical protein